MATKTAARKTAPAKKAAAKKTAPAKKAPAKKPALGIQFLVDQVKEQTGKETTGFALRIILRKLIAEGVLQRGEGRYTFTGPEDPQVVAVIDYITSGREEADKKAKTARAKKKAKPAPVEEVDLDDELDEDEDEGTEEVDLEAGFDEEDAEDEDDEDFFEDEDA